jgi:hypothetical protein
LRFEVVVLVLSLKFREAHWVAEVQDPSTDFASNMPQKGFLSEFCPTLCQTFRTR